MSMNPGATTQPDASSSWSPRRFGPISRITPSERATSATRPGAPLPSTTVPPRMTRSGITVSLQLHEVAELAHRRPGRGPTVDGQHDTGDLRGAVARQVEHRVGDVDRVAVPLERLGQLDHRAHVVVADRGGDVTGRDAVDPDPVVGEVDGCGSAVLHDGGLRHAVDDRPCAPTERGDRRG